MFATRVKILIEPYRHALGRVSTYTHPHTSVHTSVFIICIVEAILAGRMLFYWNKSLIVEALRISRTAPLCSLLSVSMSAAVRHPLPRNDLVCQCWVKSRSCVPTFRISADFDELSTVSNGIHETSASWDGAGVIWADNSDSEDNSDSDNSDNINTGNN